MNWCCSLPPLRAAIFTAATLSLVALTSATPTSAQRLSGDVVPQHYQLTFTPDIKSATFSGVESIDVTLKAPASSITLNSAEIAFQSATITAAGKLQTATITVDKDKEQVTLTVPAQLPAGKATIAIHYTGILNDKLRGFYISKTARRSYAVTQFESTDARRAFPSFDEPAFKATFDISVVIDSGDTAVSNGPIVSDTPGPGSGKHTLTFLTTPKMSTYLVAFLIGDFQCTSAEQDGVAIRSCATPDKVALTPFSLQVAKFALHYYNTYFGIPYPLKKLDLVAIPDFEAGAMENFGAITFRETTLLVDPKASSIDAQQVAAIDIAHEMAHQWFGDLVTMKWWDNVWLNEGFATWMEKKSVAAMHPEWNIDQQVISDLDNTLNLDAQPTTHAIRARADTREEIEQMFDNISYDKASEVLLTVENYLGEETFRQGVHNYLAAHLYGNATAEDFWNAQTAASHKPVDKIMESLVAQPGVPVLAFGEPSHGRVEVTQRRFYLSPSVKPGAAQTWTLPVCFKAGGDGQQCQALVPGSTALNVPPGSLFFANAGGKGYYRSTYPASAYKNLVKHVEDGLTPNERISLLGDEWASLRANKIRVGDFLDLVASVKDDPNSQVLESAIGSVQVVMSRIAASPEEKDSLAQWIRETFQPVYARLGPPSAADTPNTREFRAQLFGLLGYFGKDPGVIAQAPQIAEKYLADPSSVDPTLAQSAMAVAARHGDAALYDRLQKVYETTASPELQEGALRLLAQFEDPTLARRAFDYAASDKVRNQDAAIQFAIALQIDATRDLAWKYVQDHWDSIHSRLTPELGSILVGATGAFCSTGARDQVQQFFAAHPVASADQAVTHSIERIDGCIELRSLQEPQLRNWITAQPTPAE